uniref:Putative secreted protein n=1 Tax=Anopheles darlingi TaxID=43151 RepID=A0A2M4DB11_ANODA
MNAGRKMRPSVPLSVAAGLCAGSISWCAIPADQILTNRSQCCSKSTSCSTFASVVRSALAINGTTSLDAGEGAGWCPGVPGKKCREM